MSVLVVGALHHDVIVRAPRLPRLDETLAGQGVRYALGGKGGNQAVVAARLGARVAFHGAVGQDAAGAWLRGNLQSAGVDVAAVAEVEGASGMSVAIEDRAGAYGAVIVSGANALAPVEVQVPEGCRWVAVQNELPEEVTAAAVAAARRAGARVLWNAAPARAGADLSGADVLVMNRLEATDLLGGFPGAADAVARLPGQNAVVTLGAEGLVARIGSETLSLPAHPVRAISSHGAGDAFCGALAAELDRGAPLRQALAFARAAAALHVATPPDERGWVGRAAVKALARA